MEVDPGADFADFLAALDPDSILRAVALALAEMRVDRARDHNHVMAVAEAYYDFLDPFAMEDEDLPQLPKE